MRRHAVVLALVASVAVTGCARIADSRFNPFNWFGNSQSEQTTLIPGDAEPVVLGRAGTPIATVSAMDIDRMPGGAIITAEGITQTQGFWEPKLVEAESDDPRIVILDFEVQRPYRPHPAGAVPTRTVSAAQYLSDVRLRGVNQIIVRGAENQRVSRR